MPTWTTDTNNYNFNATAMYKTLNSCLLLQINNFLT